MQGSIKTRRYNARITLITRTGERVIRDRVVEARNRGEATQRAKAAVTPESTIESIVLA